MRILEEKVGKMLTYQLYQETHGLLPFRSCKFQSVMKVRKFPKAYVLSDYLYLEIHVKTFFEGWGGKCKGQNLVSNTHTLKVDTKAKGRDSKP